MPFQKIIKKIYSTIIILGICVCKKQSYHEKNKNKKKKKKIKPKYYLA